MVKEEILKSLQEFDLSDLEEAKKEINRLISIQNIAKKVIYKNECFNESNYHHRKYKHWAKKLTGIDISKTDGFAFEGDFLSTYKEELVDEGSYVIEHCGGILRLFLIKENEKEFIRRGNSCEMISFIKKVKEVTGL